MARSQDQRAEEVQLFMERCTPTPEPYSPVYSSMEDEFTLGAESDVDMTAGHGASPLMILCWLYTKWLPDAPLLASNVADDTEMLPPGDSSGTIPVLQYNPLAFDPSLETTPPPSIPANESGIGTVSGCEGLGPLALGQTLVVYHPFAEHPPEIINTEHLAWTREPNVSPPSEEPYTPFKTHADFEQAEIFIHHNCTDTMINDQLQLNQRVSRSQTVKNAREMHKTLAQAGQYQDTSSVSLLQPIVLVLWPSCACSVWQCGDICPIFPWC